MLTTRTYPSANAGFSLIEIMVGGLIGVISILAIMQILSISEGQKRTTTGGSDAQSNGAIALYGLQRDLRQAGFGVSAFNLLGCRVTLPTGGVLNSIAPVTINPAFIPAGDANTDTLLVVYGNSNSPPEGDGILTASAAQPYSVTTPISFAVNDYIILGPVTAPSPCLLTLTLDRVAAIAGSQLTVNPGALGAPVGVSPVINAPVYNLGQTPKFLAYAIRGGNLTVCDYTANNFLNDCANAANTGNATIWTPVSNNIVSLRVEYGRDITAPMDGIVDVYDQTPPATTCDWARISAVRLALVARNSEPSERQNGQRVLVTAAAPIWAGAAPINLTATTVPPNVTWQNYRYKLFQTIVPIRNINWLGVQAGC